MKTVFKKGLSAILALLMLLPLVAACKNEQTEETKGVLEEVGEYYNTSKFVADDLPNDLDFGGETVNFLCWSDRSEQEFTSKGIDGEKINDVIFERNSTVEQRLGVKLNYTLTPGNYDNRNAFLQTVEKDVQAGSREYDIYGSYGPLGSTFAQRGYTADLTSLEYLNFSKPWWPDNIISDMSINNKLYFATGDISTNLLWMMHGTFINTTLLENLNIEENPYELVENGQWTIAKMKEMSANIYDDVNGDSSKDTGDRYGFVSHHNVLEAFIIGSGIKAIEKDSADLPIISPEYSGMKMSDAVDELGKWLGTSEDVYCEESFSEARQIFEDGRALFITDKAYIVRTGIKEITDKYVFLPMPKYNEDQNGYRTDVGNPHTVYSISNATESEKNIYAAVLECLASESYRRLMPQLFEETMKVRYSENAEASKMYDIIRSSITFDFGKVFVFVIGNSGCEVYKTIIAKNQGNWSSTYGSIRKGLQTSLEEIIADFQ